MIFVSPEQGSADLAPLLKRAGLPVQEPLVPLDWADVEFVGRGIGGEPVTIGIEVKRLQELTSDWDRFAGEQVTKMNDHYDYRWVVYEGDWIQNKKGSLLKRTGARRFRPLHGQCNASALRKKLLTLEMCGGFHRQPTKDRSDTVRFLVDLYRWWTDDDFDEHKSLIVNYQPHGVLKQSKFVKAFAAWPHLLTQRSRSVAKHFRNSIRLASSATVEEWSDLEVVDKEGGKKRLGRKVAEDIVKFLNGEE